MRPIRIATILTVLALVFGWSAAPKAQAVVTAQILDFFRVLRVGGTWSGQSLTFVTQGMDFNAYINWGNLRGQTGYGIRDNSGVIETKNSGGDWSAIGGGANPNGTFLVRTSAGAPPLAQVMANLATGLVFNTTTTGTQSIYAGTTCSATFPRSLSALGVATCVKVNLAADVTGVLPGTSFPALSGDVTATAGSTVTALSLTGVSGASRGSATSIPTFTVDTKGRLTAAGAATPQLTLTSTYLSSLSASALTSIPAAQLTGTIAAGAFPALTGDVTNTVGSLATTVGSVGGQAVSLGGAFTTSGANNLTFTTTGATSVTLPTSGTLISTTITSLPSLVSVGTIATGVWQATPVGVTYGGTGLVNPTAHGPLVGEGSSPAFAVVPCNAGVLAWTVNSVDPTCSVSPIITSLGLTGSSILGGTGIAGGAVTNTSITKTVTGIADASATAVIAVSVPNAGHAAVIHVRIVGALGAGGAIGAFECSNVLEGNVEIARTTGLTAVPTAATATMVATSCVAGATTETLAYSLSGVSGGAGGTQTFNILATITKGGGSSANHTAFVEAEVLNAVATGVTIS